MDWFIAEARRRTDALVLIGYTLLTVGFTYPLAFRIGTALPGIPHDTYLYIWNLEWVRRALLELGTNPFFTQDMYYPTGVNLYFHTLILGSDFLTLPLQLAFGLPAAYMIMTLAIFVLTGYGAYLLAFDFVRNRGAAFLAGLVFTFSPYHLGHLNYAHFDSIALQWIPFTLLAVKKYLERPSPKLFFLALLLLIWVSITNWYYTLFTALLIGLYAIYAAWRARSAIPLLRLGLVGIAYVILLSPLFLSMYNVIASGQVLPARALRQANRFSADLLALVVPTTQHPIWGGFVSPLANQFSRGSAERGVFYGYVPMVLAAWAILRRRDPPILFWAGIVFVFSALALGPVLHVGGIQKFGQGQFEIVMPQMLLYHIPGLSAIFNFARAIARFSIIAMLGIAILAAYGFQDLSRKFSFRKALGFLVLTCVLVGLEFVVNPIPTTPLQVPDIIEEWRDDPDKFAVMDLPPRSNKIGAISMYYWTVDGKPRIDGYHSQKVPIPFYEGVESIRQLKREFKDILVGPQPTSAQVLQFFDIRYVMVHEGSKLAEASKQEITRQWGARSAIWTDGSHTVYQVPKTEPTPLVVMFDPTTSMSKTMGWGPPQDGQDGIPRRLMTKDANILIYTQAPQVLAIGFDAVSPDKAHDLQVFMNEKVVYQGRVDAEAPTRVQFEVAAQSGENVLKFHIVDTQGISEKQSSGKPGNDSRMSFSQMQVQLAK